MAARRRQSARRLLFACAILQHCFSSTCAVAQTPAVAAPGSEPSDAALTGARERYRAGAAAYSEGRFKDAIDFFLEADKLRPSAALSFNIARAYEKLRDAAGALRWYRDYLRRANNPDDGAQVQALVATLSNKLREKGIQQVTVLSEPLGATVIVDREPVGVTPWTGELAPGTHRVELRLRGYADAARDFELPATTAIDVQIPLSPSTTPNSPSIQPTSGPRAASASADARSESAIPLRTWGYVTLGAAGAAFTGALAFELMRRSAEKNAENQEVQTQFVEDVDRMEARRTTARVFAGVGTGLAVVGGVLVAVDLLNGRRESARRLRQWQVSCTTVGCSTSWSRNF